jgi:hypothetical protein
VPVDVYALTTQLEMALPNDLFVGRERRQGEFDRDSG